MRSHPLEMMAEKFFFLSTETNKERVKKKTANYPQFTTPALSTSAEVNNIQINDFF